MYEYTHNLHQTESKQTTGMNIYSIKYILSFTLALY